MTFAVGEVIKMRNRSDYFVFVVSSRLHSGAPQHSVAEITMKDGKIDSCHPPINCQDLIIDQTSHVQLRR